MSIQLTFPKKNCKEVEFNGKIYITVDTQLTADELIRGILKHTETGETIGVKKE